MPTPLQPNDAHRVARTDGAVIVDAAPAVAAGVTEGGTAIDLPGGGTLEIPAGVSRISILRRPAPRDPRDVIFDGLVRVVERLAERLVGPLLDTAPPVPAARTLPVPVATTLDDYRIVRPPFMERLFHQALAQAQASGRTFPSRFDLAFVDASEDRPCDGRTTRSASGAIRVVINVNAGDLLATIFHELAHVADFHQYGTRFARDEMERRAVTFVQSMKAPKPVSLGAPYSPANRRRYY